jgi:hypothetical protein
MAYLVFTLEEIVSILKKHLGDDIPSAIKQIRAKDDRVVIFAYGVNIVLTFNDFTEGVIAFNISANKILKLIFDLFKGKLSRDYISVTSSKLEYEINSHLKKMDIDIKINDITENENEYKVHFSA